MIRVKQSIHASNELEARQLLDDLVFKIYDSSNYQSIYEQKPCIIKCPKHSVLRQRIICHPRTGSNCSRTSSVWYEFDIVIGGNLNDK